MKIYCKGYGLNCKDCKKEKCIDSRGKKEEKQNNAITDAIELLRINGYIVIKETPRMKADADKCAEMSERGEDMDCLECACSVCIIQ